MYGVVLGTFDDDGNMLPRDGKTPGNLKCKGPWTLESYFKAEGSSVDKDGWFDTGVCVCVCVCVCLCVRERGRERERARARVRERERAIIYVMLMHFVITHTHTHTHTHNRTGAY